ncbi:hypothetical protein [Peribacillus frigoritolerans]|uniref:hypothetical protein n=1 Tax=Peribacillus castrilensis TaxID=2897690 RepID=UPI003DA4FD54
MSFTLLLVSFTLLLVNFTFTREFHAFTREFCAFTREVGAIHKKETPLLARFPEYILHFCSLITSRHI